MFSKILVCTDLSPDPNAMIQCARDALSLFFLQPHAALVRLKDPPHCKMQFVLPSQFAVVEQIPKIFSDLGKTRATVFPSQVFTLFIPSSLKRKSDRESYFFC